MYGWTDGLLKWPNVKYDLQLKFSHLAVRNSGAWSVFRIFVNGNENMEIYFLFLHFDLLQETCST